jgi:hypothetical protein
MKVKELSMLEQEKQFEHDLSYGEYLREGHNKMEKVFCKAKILKTNKHLHPLNNLYYQPLKGA